jgi:Leucine-rich repeat (LRR) protein
MSEHKCDEKYIVYKNDLKYRKHRNLEESKIEFFNDEVKNMFNHDLDTIEYRIKECVESNCSTLDLKCMDLTDDTFPNISLSIAKKVKFLFLSENNLTKIPEQLINFKNIEVLDVSHNKIINVKHLPISLLELCISYNPLITFSETLNCNNIVTLDCSNCKLKTIPNFINLKLLLCGHNNIVSICNFNNLKKLLCDTNKIKEIKGCPNIEYLDCNKNPINLLDNNMCALEHLICSDTILSTLPYKSPIKTIESFNNNIHDLRYIATLNEFLCNVNQLDSISSRYKIKSINEHKKKFIHILFDKLN